MEYNKSNIHSKVFLIITLLSISSCAATNTIHAARDSIRVSEVKEHGGVRMVKAASFDSIKNDIYLCITGDFKQESYIGDKDYTLKLKNSVIVDSHINKSCKRDYYHDWVSYKSLKDGCSFTTNKKLIPFKLKSIKVWTDLHSTQEVEIDKYVSQDYNDLAIVNFDLPNTDSSTAIELSVSNSRPNSLSANRLRINIKGGDNYYNFTSAFMMASISSENSYDRHKYEIVGIIIDVVTGVIQLPVCGITVGRLCSLSPHPDLH